ncbi:CDP-glycerol glycerophosphotransferase family protein [Enterococcus sp. BWM-S5]|uniref:CDP-glycerol glycerophosphotransferase family protein n=1 Tax=Enterococcus larvae TaxID=2794352 RepID=A0ABS4CIC9_9ENTE|nr:CDP-glycerol glycerophosphotransferase family protein [Enterococcus larvae]MBP1046352.1 CDP-glycerol glycerophosphotransferase family protein [Enterococcus larvae]
MNKLLGQIKKLKLRDIRPLFLLVIMFIPGKIYKMINRDVWVITEYENNARDNGYWLFKYIREHDPNRKVFYPINLECSDFERIKPLGNYIKFGGVKHYLLFWGCNKFIGTTKYYGFPYGRICEDLVQWNFHGFKNVFLNHGVARGYSSIVDGRETNYDMIVTMSEKEKEIMLAENYQVADRIKVIGFCRCDTLKSHDGKKNKILVMPTWRNWLDFRLEVDPDKKREVTDKFLESTYYKRFFSLINSEELISFLESNDLELILYLHNYAQIYSQYFHSTSDRITIAFQKDYFIQDLLRETSLLITDYSSVNYDFCYMKKPMIYYQFDQAEFTEKQYSESKYFTYEEDGFGPVTENEQDLLREMQKAYSANWQVDKKYLDRIDDFFEFFDEHNCERNYKEILNL